MACEIKLKNVNPGSFWIEQVEWSTMGYAVVGNVRVMIGDFDKEFEGKMRIVVLYQKHAEGVIKDLKRRKVPVDYGVLKRVNINYTKKILEISGDLVAPYLYTADVEIPLSEIESVEGLLEYLQHLEEIINV